jgi:hypothetical protein
MFHYVYLNKKKNLIDIRLNTSITPFNFHQHIENLGLINILLIIAWELKIIYIKIGDIVGQIDFTYNYINYNIYHYSQKLKSTDNYLELVEDNIRLKYKSYDVKLTSGFLNWKKNKFPMHKAKVRPDIITSNGTILKQKLHNDMLTGLSNNSDKAFGNNFSTPQKTQKNSTTNDSNVSIGSNSVLEISKSKKVVIYKRLEKATSHPGQEGGLSFDQVSIAKVFVKVSIYIYVYIYCICPKMIMFRYF